MRNYRPTWVTEREEQVLSLRADGMSGKEIAQLLGIAWATVRVYQWRATRKLGMRTCRGAIRRYRQERFRRLHNGVNEPVNMTRSL